MPKIILVAAGAHRAPQRFLKTLAPDDVLIAVNGGHHVLAGYGLTPHRTIGDLDSLSEAERQTLIENPERVELHPVEKDATDGQLALDWVLQQPAWDGWPIWFWGGFGDRFDHALALLLYVATLEDHHRILLTDGVQWGYVVSDGITLKGSPKDVVSLIPLDGSVTGIQADGLKYPLAGHCLTWGQTLGVSNELVENSATVRITGRGRLAVIHHREADAIEPDPP